MRLAPILAATLFVSSSCLIPLEAGEVFIAKGYSEKWASSLKEPIGLDALGHIEKLKRQEWKQNVETSNRHILAHLTAFETGSPEYRRQLAELMYGHFTEGGLGWFNFLTDPENLGQVEDIPGWDEKVRAAVGDAGYAEIIAFFTAFEPGSGEFAHTFGGERRFDPKENTLSLNTSPVVVQDFPLGHPETFAEQTRAGGRVREQILNFYRAFREGRIEPQQLDTFNTAMVQVGGCALVETSNPDGSLGFLRYNAGLNYLASALSDLGFPVESGSYK